MSVIPAKWLLNFQQTGLEAAVDIQHSNGTRLAMFGRHPNNNVSLLRRYPDNKKNVSWDYDINPTDNHVCVGVQRISVFHHKHIFKSVLNYCTSYRSHIPF